MKSDQYSRSCLSYSWVVVTLVIHVLLFFVVWCCFSGWVNYDAGLQWGQVQTGQYNNWHPFAHTIAFMKLPSLLWNDYRVVILSQIVIFSIAIGYLAKTLELCGGGKILRRCIMLSLLAHPLTIFFIQTMPKDSVFAVCVLLSLSATLRIIASQGEDLRKWSTVIVLSFGLSFACLVRHNGIFFSVPLLFMLIMKYFRHGKLLRCMIGMLVLMTLFKVALPYIFYVSPASQHSKKYLFIESAGMPLTIMGAVYVKHPDEIPGEVAALLESIRPREIWLERYKLGSFNLVKHAGVSRLSEETIAGIKFQGWMHFAKAFYGTVEVDPKTAISAFIALTEQVWNPFTFQDEDIEFPLVKTGLWKYRGIILPIVRLMHIPILGMIPLVVLSLVCMSVMAVAMRRYNALVLSIPMLCYNFGTMMLLSGFNMQRLFFCNVLVGLPVIWSMVKYE